MMNKPLTFRTLNRITINPPTTDTRRIYFQNTTFFPNNNCIPLVLPTFTLRPFPSTAFFHLPYLSITSFNDFPHKTKLSAYNSILKPSLTSYARTSITIINKGGLKTDPWLKPTFTENEPDSSPSTETAVLQSL